MIHIILAIWHWLQEVLGFNIGIPGHTPRWYNGLSGSGSDITEIAIVFAAIGLYKRHNCAWHGCPRLARKHWEVKGTPLRTCHHHATKQFHALLLKEYKRDNKEQHALFNQ